MPLEADVTAKLTGLFREWKGIDPERLEPLPPTASNRTYVRLHTQQQRVIGCWNENIAENESFIYLSNHFLSKGLSVPQVYTVSADGKAYLQEDMGHITLFDHIQALRSIGEPEKSTWEKCYHPVIDDLIRFQTDGHQGLDYSRCYPSPRFGRREIHADLNYFRYYFLRLSGLSFHEDKLQNGLDALAERILNIPAHYFMYRDFQSRNIMVRPAGYAYIDFQGGRQGPLQYDLASLLLNTRADIPLEVRDALYSYYIERLQDKTEVRTEEFRQDYLSVALLRVLQTMGAYGFRGYFERKRLFLSGIPFGQRNLRWLLDQPGLSIENGLREILEEVATSTHLTALAKDKLNVQIRSFSYKRGIPVDLSGHGGGFVFDCRILPNPGRYPEYQSLTGKDDMVRTYLSNQPEVDRFLSHVADIAIQAVDNYLQRGFQHLSLHFGCTGGRHRSVYCAEAIAARLKAVFDIDPDLRHLEIG